MIDDKDKSLKALHDLVATCNEAAEGYGKAAKGVGDTELSNWLAQISNDRQAYGAELTSLIRDLGGEGRTDLHEGGILHRGWVDLETRIRPKEDREILRECLAGDGGTLKHYDNALARDLDPNIRSVVIQQRTGVEDVLISLESRVNRGRSQTA